MGMARWRQERLLWEGPPVLPACWVGECGQAWGLTTGPTKAQDGAPDSGDTRAFLQECGASPAGSPTKGAPRGRGNGGLGPGGPWWRD